MDNALPHASGAHGSGHAQAAATPPSTRLGQQLADPAGGSPDRVTGRQLSEATGTVPAAGRLGSAAAEAVGAAKSAVAQAAQQAAAAGAQAPTWALLLLGASVGAAVAVQLWHLLAPRRNLVVRQGSTAAEEQAAEGLALPADGSTLADVRIGAAEQLLMPASIQLASAKQPEQAVGELSPPGSPASPSARGPPALCVDPTVRARDASKREWAMTAPDEQRRTSEFHNPLFGSGSGELRCEGSLEAEGEGSSVGSPAGTSPTQGGRPWPTKEAALHLGRGDSEAADGSDNFRVPAGLPAPAPGPSSGSSSHSSSAGRELASPGSPGKAPRGAARKLTGAKSVGPQELLPPLEEVEEEEAGAAPAAAAQADLSTRDATAKRAGGNGSSGSSRTQTPAVRPSPHAPSCSSGPASPRADALRGLCLLSPAQFQVGLVVQALCCMQPRGWAARSLKSYHN